MADKCTIIISDEHLESINIYKLSINRDNLENTSLVSCSRVETKFKKEKQLCDLCKKQFVCLSSHLKVHGLSPDERKEMCHAKRKRKSTKAASDRKCPFLKCSKTQVYVRIDKHLQYFHKFKTDHPMYRRFINTYGPRQKTSKSKQLKSNDQVFEKSNYSDEKLSCLKYSTTASAEFFTYCLSLNGGRMSIYNAKQYKSKIQQILVGSDIQKTEDFDSLEVLGKLSKWFESYTESHKESSACCYISILVKFLKFIGVQNPSKFNIYNSLIHTIQNWTRSFKAGKISGRKDVNDISKVEIRAFEESEISLKCINILIMLENGTMYKVTNGEHSQIRNYLLLEAIVRNGCRSCVLVNMTLQELEDPKKEVKGGTVYYVIFVENHKTRKEHGPAMVTLEENLYKQYICYAHKIRPQIVPVNSDVQTVFITWTGISINSDNLYKGINSIWKEAGLKTSFTTTVIRKIVTTRIHSLGDNESKDVLARHLCHRQSTAEKCYKTLTKSTQSVDASEMVYKTLSGYNIRESTSNSELPMETPEFTSLCPGSNSLDLNTVAASCASYTHESQFSKSITQEDCESKVDNLEACNENYVNDSSLVNVQISKGNPFFTNRERKTIFEVFYKRYIKLKKIPSMQIIRMTSGVGEV
ncbi:hypothetical protein Anas_14441 [Armadillidium nasatum]|uniref:Uncharacterized protein n=1 Tax=Armadillidium nasatum TaxID=96803 RepID=A0A5N5T0T8_9CRUS|nr:hypothetical protein Anas_14441 [Armadillidium nasatum]